MKKIVMVCICLALLVSFTISNSLMGVRADELLAPNSKSAILIDANSGSILAEQDSEHKLPIASIVKLMTLCIVFDHIDAGEISLDDEVVASEYACSMGGSQLFLDANSKHKVSDLLKSVIVASANDSSVVLAEVVSGNENAFVKEMNAKASVLGLNNTLYTDSTGLREDQYSTAKDVATLSKYVLNHPLYQKYSKIWLEEYTHPSGRVTEIANTNKLIRTLDGCIGGKTGTTDSAGYCLTLMAERNDMKLISVVLGADNTQHRFEDNKNVIEFGFANFENHKIISKDTAIGVLNNNRVKPSEVELYAVSDYGIVAPKNEEIDATYQIELYDLNQSAKANECIGKAYVLQNGDVVGEVCVVAKEDLNMKNYKDYIIDIVNLW